MRQAGTRAKIRKLFSSGQPHFTVAHFAGEVVYEASGWIERNNDELHADLLEVLGGSKHPLIAAIFPRSGGAGGRRGTVVMPTICQASSDTVPLPHTRSYRGHADTPPGTPPNAASCCRRRRLRPSFLHHLTPSAPRAH